MGLGRAWLLVLFLAPLLPTGAEAAGSQSIDTSFSRREYRIGESITFIVQLHSFDEWTSLPKTIDLWNDRIGTRWGSVGSGAIAVSPGSYASFAVTWPTASLAPSWFGNWRAVYTTQWGTATVPFDLDYGPDFTVRNVTVRHAPFMFNFNFLRDGTTKIVEGCVEDIGPQPLQSMQVSLFFRLHADPLMFGGTQNPRIATEDWRQGHVVETKTVPLAYPTQRCAFPYQNAWAVRFDWKVTDDLILLSPALYAVGIRVDAANTVWELSDTNNDKDVQTTISPISTTFLP